MRPIRSKSGGKAQYTRGEEIFSMVSHIVGGAVGITAVALCVIMAALHHNTYGVVGGAVFGAMMIVYYCMSSIYHGLYAHLTSKRVFRVLTHCAAYLLVAGTYTPVALCTLREKSTALGWTCFGIVWGFSVAGILLNALALEKCKVVSAILYIAFWWSVMLTVGMLSDGLRAGGLSLLFSGILAYTAGVVFFIFEKKHAYLHSVGHLFTLAGSSLHLLCILFFVV